MVTTWNGRVFVTTWYTKLQTQVNVTKLYLTE